MSPEPAPDLPATLHAFSTYRGIIQSLLRAAPATTSPFVAEAESASALQIERGTLWARLLVGQPIDGRMDRVLELSRSSRMASTAVVDRTGHHRPAYRALLVYAGLKAFSLAYETIAAGDFGRWEEGLRAWCDLLEAQLGEMNLDDTWLWAARGSTATEACWTALALHSAGKLFVRDAWTDLAADVFGRLTRGQQKSGAFLKTETSDNPETHWYHELVVLHAAASYAVTAQDRPVAAAVARNAAFHLAETQPDHATTQPWGLFAFVWNPDTRSLADQLLHGVQTQHAGGVDGVSAILAADAMACLALFAK